MLDRDKFAEHLSEYRGKCRAHAASDMTVRVRAKAPGDTGLSVKRGLRGKRYDSMGDASAAITEWWESVADRFSKLTVSLELVDGPSALVSVSHTYEEVGTLATISGSLPDVASGIISGAVPADMQVVKLVLMFQAGELGRLQAENERLGKLLQRQQTLVVDHYGTFVEDMRKGYGGLWAIEKERAEALQGAADSNATKTIIAKEVGQVVRLVAQLYGGDGAPDIGSMDEAALEKLQDTVIDRMVELKAAESVEFDG